MNRKILSLLLAALLVLGASGCGSSANYEASESAMAAPAMSASSDSGYWNDFADEEEAPAETAGSGVGESVYTADNVKLIRTAWLSMETKTYDDACAFIERTVQEMGGYFGNVEQYRGGYYNAARSVSYTARIPAAQYDAFLQALSGSADCAILSKSESTEDVGLQYADIENHIEMLNTKLQRLNELMAQAKDMEDIITIQNAISEAEQELSSYRSDINRYDNLIGFATITLSVEEVVEYSPAAEKGFLERMVDSFTSGWDSFVWGMEDLILFLVGNIFGIIFLVIVIFVIVKIISRLRRRSHREPRMKQEKVRPFGRKKAEKAVPAPETSAADNPAEPETPAEPPEEEQK